MRPYERAIREMEGRAEIERNNGFEIAASVADKILTAKTVEEAIAAANTSQSMDDLVGKPFRLTGYLMVNKSAEQFREGGVGSYVNFSVLDMNNNRKTYGTGAVNVVFTFKRLEELGFFSSEDWVSEQMFTIKSRPTPAGQMYTVDFA